MNIPEDTEKVFFMGAYHKLGPHGKPYIWMDGQWKRSTKSEHEIRRELAKLGG